MAIDFNDLSRLSLLSVAAYDDADHEVGPVQGKLPDGWDALDLGQLGLAVHPILDHVVGAPLLQYTVNGYFRFHDTGIDAEAFAAQVGNDVIIVFRGTEAIFSSVVADLLLDVGIVVGRLNDALEGLAPFIDAVRDYAQRSGARLLATGHSLGGALAEKLFQLGGVAGGAGFGSPGISALPVDGGNPNFIHIARQSDEVGTLFDDSHAGTSIYLYGDGLSFFSPPFASHDSGVYRDQMANLAASAAFDGVLPQSIAGSVLYAAHPNQAVTSSDVWNFKFAIGSDLGDTITGTTLGGVPGTRLGGGDGADSITGIAGNDTIFGDSGDDTIKGSDGSDELHGGSGNDRIEDLEGDSVWVSRDDFIFGDDGDDTILAGGGDNYVYGGSGNDSIWAGSGSDHLFGESDNDSIHASGGGDFVYGGDGSDTLYGDEGGDDIRGQAGTDFLYGGTGNDTLYGGTESDQLRGEGGQDILVGEQGADRFFIDPNAYVAIGPIEVDEIRDYNAADGDVIDISELVALAGGTGQPETALWRPSGYQGGTYLEVDPDGAGAMPWRTLARLTGVDPGAAIKVYTGTGDAEQPAAQPAVSPPGSYSISPSSRSVNEDAGSVTFTITRPVATNSETVYVSTTFNRGSANGSDYVGWLNEPITFAAGQTSKSVTIVINDDSHDETAEQFGLIVQSSPDQPASRYLAAASFTIIDNDDGPGSAFTEGDDIVWLEPPLAFQLVDGLGGHDTVVLDYRSVSGGFYTTTYGTIYVNGNGIESLSINNVEGLVVLGGSGDDTIGYGMGGLSSLEAATITFMQVPELTCSTAAVGMTPSAASASATWWKAVLALTELSSMSVLQLMTFSSISQRVRARAESGLALSSFLARPDPVRTR